MSQQGEPRQDPEPILEQGARRILLWHRPLVELQAPLDDQPSDPMLIGRGLQLGGVVRGGAKTTAAYRAHFLPQFLPGRREVTRRVGS